MASAENAKPTCPVCHQADKVKTTQAAYNSGVTRCAPPDMPTKQVTMTSYISACMVLVGICVFLIIVFIGGLENNFPQPAMLALVITTIVCIITSLAVSYYAFQRVVRGDNEVSAYYPAWDKAMATWKNWYYCSRDEVVFDPQTNKVVSSDQLTKVREFRSQPDALKTALAAHS
ncbi:hypothetical protein [Tengunoibacter tsumagoiensis]|uniref:Uncharacterized protein n=1 Tax=Tengunoibacter tsumagoiensis TaxID=2014871 RepID=A0A401ZTV8_9CHLR|nr:hypothetical protein [Tengunoibacter tsumagoiensis]GCE10242.1 hypothetical protein KTT_01010 [Tengunoibacter tsumagoiensis]